MNILTPWNIAFFMAFIALFWIRTIFVRCTKDEQKIEKRRQRSERPFLIAMAPGSLPLPLLYLFSPLLSFADYTLPLWVLLTGMASLWVSLWLFWRSHADLGQNWSVRLEVRKGHELITHGVYTHIRHPMYASMWLWGIGQALILQNWLAGWSFIIAFAGLYFFRVQHEEKLMIDYFPTQYTQYMEKTGRIIPKYL